MKYPKLLKRLETLEMVTYFHDDNAEDMYRNIMQIVATAKPQTKEQEHQIIYDTLYLWGPKRLREICIDKDYKFP
ncbi:hypothetical protein AAGS13_002805 [Listeria innocua]|nr:hypothetical protein [Listeria innocua]